MHLQLEVVTRMKNGGVHWNLTRKWTVFLYYRVVFRMIVNVSEDNKV